MRFRGYRPNRPMYIVPHSFHHSPRSYKLYDCGRVCNPRLLAVGISLKKYAAPLLYMSDKMKSQYCRTGI